MASTETRGIGSSQSRDCYCRCRPLVLLMHLPKAGGTSLTMAFKDQHGAAAIHSVQPDQTPEEAARAFSALTRERKSRLEVVAGHFGTGHGIEKHVMGPVLRVTMLRDPVRRVVSHYRYIRRRLAEGADFSDRPWFLDAKRMSLVDYVRYGRTGDLRNGQTKFLAGTLDWWGQDPENAEGGQVQLEKALQFIDSPTALVGLVERFPESLSLFRHALSWARPVVIHWSNASLENPDVSASCGRQIERLNEMDIELYRYASARFQEVVNERSAIVRWGVRAARIATIQRQITLLFHRVTNRSVRLGKASLRHLLPPA